MSFNFHQKPWQHATYDNFLCQEDYLKILDISKGIKVASTEKIFFSHKIRKGKIEESNIFDNDFLMHLYSKYSSTVLSYLDLHNSWKKFFYDYADISLQINGPDFEDKIHLDVPRKLVSGVVYLNSSKPQLGTLIYDKYGNPDSESITEWKDNRAMFFSRSAFSYHSYKGNGKSQRVTLIYNLCTDKKWLIKKLDYLNNLFLQN